MTHYKFLDEVDGKLRSRSGDHTWEIGKWYQVQEPVSACSHGFHCSPAIYAAFSYVAGSVVAEVEVRGTPDDQGDKAAYPEMRIVRAWKFTKRDTVSLAAYSAELVIGNFEVVLPGDDRPRKAIEAAKTWLAHPSPETGYAARYAAESARYAAESAAEYARYAARSAGYAARSAGYAARSARYAAESARYAAGAAGYAGYAAESALLAKVEAWFQVRLSSLEEIK